MLLAIAVLALQVKKTDPASLYVPPTAPPWQGQGGIKSDDLKNEHRDENGNVTGTEFFHLEYNVSTRIVPLPEDCWVTAFDCICQNLCQGKMHKSHAECNVLCDKVCTKDHHFSLQGYYEELRPNMNKMTADSAALNKRAAGNADPPDWSSQVSNELKEAETEAKNSTVDETPPHIFDPCSSDRRQYGFKPSQFQVHAEMHKVGFYMSKGIKTPMDEIVGTQDGVVALLYYPSSDPLSEVKGVICFCEKKVIPPKEHPERFDYFVPFGTGFFWLDGSFVFGGDKIEVTAHGIDLNEAEIDVENKSGTDVRLHIPPGTLLESEDDEAQTMTTLEYLDLPCPAEVTTRLRVEYGPFAAGAPTVIKPRVECTEIAKHMPTTSTKMHLEPGKNDHLVQLCGLYGKENFHFGSLDQVRAWVLLSHSSVEEINKKLIPPVLEGTYLTALSDVASTGVNVAAKEYQPCADLNLFTGFNATRKAVVWYVRYWETRDASALVAYASKLAEHEKEVLPTGSGSEVRHVADLGVGFLSSTDSKVRMAGLDLLDSVPAEKRAEAMRNGALDGLWDCLSSKNEAEVLKALAVADEYQAKSYMPQVSSLAGWSSNANVKMAAAALKAKLAG